MKSEFNPKLHKGKNTITLKTGFTGIRVIWDWSQEKSQYIRRDKGLRFVAVKKIHGRQYEKSFHTMNEAKEWYKTYSPILAKSYTSLTFESLIHKYFEHISEKINHSTLQTYRNNSIHLKELNKYEVRSITPQVIDEWLRRVKRSEYIEQQHNTRMSYQKEIGLLTRVFTYYSEYLDDNFQSPIKRRHKVDSIINHSRYKEAKSKNSFKFMTNEQCLSFVEKLKEKASRKQDDYGYYCLALLQLHTGLRVGEACALRWADLTFKNDSVEICINKIVQWKRAKESKTYIQPFTKTGVQRTVFIGLNIASVLREWIQARGTQGGLIFSFDGNEPFLYRSVQNKYDSAFKACGLPFRSSHILRHTFSTDFLQNTRDQHALSKLLGHTTTRQTEHYAKITNQMIHEGYSQYKKHLEETYENVVNFPVELGRAGCE